MTAYVDMETNSPFLEKQLTNKAPSFLSYKKGNYTIARYADHYPLLVEDRGTNTTTNAIASFLLRASRVPVRIRVSAAAAARGPCGNKSPTAAEPLQQQQQAGTAQRPRRFVIAAAAHWLSISSVH